ncbi:MAG: LCP family protein [Eubacteriales bacterium]|nr:LCP family protein [Eubacteriales bacterium]
MSKRKNKSRFRWIAFIVEVIILLILAGALFVGYQLTRIDHVKVDEKEISANDNIDTYELNSMTGYQNIALFGVDSRAGELESGTNSDTIMVCSINKKTKEVKLVSVYRDTYLDVGDGNYQKANAAYAIGGAQRAVAMLNKNLDLNITDYATVNFEALVDIIDVFGGVDIEVTEDEVTWLNAYLVEARQVLNKECEDVYGSGMLHLNGMQALAYCRIRYIGLDYERTERQRKVLAQVMAHAKNSSVVTLTNVVTSLLPEISTSLSMSEILSLATSAGSYNMGETQGFPYDKTTMDTAAGDCVVPVNLAANVTTLHAFLYGSQDYTPSATVQEISNYISAETGV